MDGMADSQPKLVGLVWGLAATRRSVCIHQMNRLNSHSNIIVVINIIIISGCGLWWPQQLDCIVLYINFFNVA